MTCRDKLKMDRPELSDLDVQHMVNVACPSDPRHEYMCDPDWCGDGSVSDRCNKCWNREIPETETVENKEEVNEMEIKTTKKTKAELLNEIAALKKEVENLDKYRQYEQVADELAAMRDALMNKGFTREEAIQFIFNAMNSMVK